MYLYIGLGAILLLSGGVILAIGFDKDSSAICMTGLVPTVFGFSILLIMLFATPVIYHNTKFINSISEKQYTMNDIFWNYEDIKTLVIGQKYRVEIEK